MADEEISEEEYHRKANKKGEHAHFHSYDEGTGELHAKSMSDRKIARFSNEKTARFTDDKSETDLEIKYIAHGPPSQPPSTTFSLTEQDTIAEGTEECISSQNTTTTPQTALTSETSYASKIEEDIKYEHELLEASDVECEQIAKEQSIRDIEFESEIRPETTGFLRGVELGPHLQPFKLHWVFGVNTDVKVLNLSNTHRNSIVFTASQGVIIYNVATAQMKILEGHQNGVSAISIDMTGQYLATCDIGDDNSVVIWDTYEAKPIYTIFDPYPVEKTEASSSSSSDQDFAPVRYGGDSDSEESEEAATGTAVLSLSDDAKYLVTVANDIPTVKLWLWTYGKDVADATLTITPHSIGKCVAIDFHPNKQEYIMLAFEKAVCFVTWCIEKHKFVHLTKTEIRHRNKFGFITDCTYIQDCHECLASADGGAVHFFGRAIHQVPFLELELKNDLIYMKTVKVSRVASIKCIHAIDDYIVMGDSIGRVSFYDKSLKILYWIKDFQVQGVSAIGFKLEPRKYKFGDATKFKDDMFVLESPRKILENQLEDISEEVEVLYKSLLPKDATLKREPFISRDFVLMCTSGNIYQLDFVNQKLNLIFSANRFKVTAMEIHSESPYLLTAFENGQICLVNYETLEQIICHCLPDTMNEQTQEKVKITAIKYSPQSLRLACGRSNGELWFLEPILQRRMKEIPFWITKNAIMKICFSNNSNYCAYFDENQTVVLLRYDHNVQWWKIHGKYRSHCKPINDIMFSPYVAHTFFTIGQDRYLVEYNAKKSVEDEIHIHRREKIEQSAIPLCFTYLNQQLAAKKYEFILYTNDQYKYKIILEANYQQRGTYLGPAYGCYSEFPVKKIINIPGHDDRYFLFATDRHIGIQSVPLCGNPYTYLGMFGHPKKLLEVCVTFDGKYIFTVGQDDPAVLMWETNVSAVDHLEEIGGKNLQPYYCLIEGGPTGWLFKEMQDLFFYMQILHQDENTLTQRIVCDKIPVVELPDLMRACGFYPTEYEISCLLSDIKNRDMNTTDELRTDLSFLEFVELYVNHRPAHGVSIEELEESYNTFCDYAGGYGSVDRDQFIEQICHKGEFFSMSNAHKCLSVLMHEEPASTEDIDEMDFEFFPDNIGFTDLIEDILGVGEDKRDAVGGEEAEEEENDSNL